VQSHQEEYPTRSRRERGWNRGVIYGEVVCVFYGVDVYRP
jgi:hypothetical protein